MGGLRRIVSNTLISLLGQLVTWTSTLCLTIAYGRFLNDVKFGELYFAITFVSLIGFPVEVGFTQQVIRDVATEREKAHTYLWNTLLIKTGLWIVAYGVMLLIVYLLGYGQEQEIIVAICGISLLSGSIVSTFAALHCAFERLIFPAVGVMLEKGLSAVVGYFVLKNGGTVQMMALVLLGGSLVDACWVIWWLFRRDGVRIGFEKATMIKLIRTSIPFILYGALGVIYYRIDTVLLSLMTSTAVVGWYGASYRLFDTLLFIPNVILNAVMYPVFSRLSVNSRSGLQTAVEKCMNLLLVCSIPMAAFMIVAAPAIIGFLYHSQDFVNSVPVMQALAPGLVFLYINTLFSSIIVALKGEKKIPIMAAAALVFNLGLNLVLIPYYQQVGAAAVTSLTELLLMCISITFVPRYLLPKKSIIVGVKTLVAALCMAGVLFFLRTSSIFILIPMALLIYSTVATLLRTIPREDVESLYRAIKRKGTNAGVETGEKAARVVDENEYLQISHPDLPVVIGRGVVHGLIRDEEDEVDTEVLARPRYMERRIGEDGEATEIVPAFPRRKRYIRK